MADGPAIESLFRGMQCLNVEHNLGDIVKYLRFVKDEGTYQTYLAHYLPMLVGKPEFNDFIGDVENKDLAKDLKAKNNEPTAEELATEQADLAAKAAKKAEKEAAKAAKKVK